MKPQLIGLLLFTVVCGYAQNIDTSNVNLKASNLDLHEKNAKMHLQRSAVYLGVGCSLLGAAALGTPLLAKYNKVEGHGPFAVGYGMGLGLMGTFYDIDAYVEHRMAKKELRAF